MGAVPPVPQGRVFSGLQCRGRFREEEVRSDNDKRDGRRARYSRHASFPIPVWSDSVTRLWIAGEGWRPCGIPPPHETLSE